MKQWIQLLCATMVVLALTGARASADLDSYLKRPEPDYKWEKIGEKEAEGCKVYDLHMVSQVWQGITWEHHVEIFKPDNLKHPEFCAIYNTGGNGSLTKPGEMGVELSKATGCLFCIMWNNPKQPLYGGKTEDALIVHTWRRFLTTGDESWPLHFPMAKAVLKTIDTVQAFAKSENWKPVTSFLTCGASKRGWTTWLTGASRDPRIKAIAPMVIDTLNLPVQFPHMLAVYGSPSVEISDYGVLHMSEVMSTPRGRRLVELEDPYSYRDRLTLPKLIILGTNDPYWTQDALNNYWDALIGPKWVTYTPNSAHNLKGELAHAYATLAAFIARTADHVAWPQLRWRYTKTATGVDLVLTSDIPMQSARLFQNHSDTTDFREQYHWTNQPMQGKGKTYRAHFDAPADGNEAIFGEASYTVDGHEFTLSSQIYVLGKNASVFVEPGANHPAAP
jgi:PhoPQ-activated pathogenicity-related protein